MSKVTFAPKAAFGAALLAGFLMSAKYMSANNRIHRDNFYTSNDSVNKVNTVNSSDSIKNKTNTNEYNAKTSIAIATGDLIKNYKSLDYRLVDLFDDDTVDNKDEEKNSKTDKPLKQISIIKNQDIINDYDDDNFLIKFDYDKNIKQSKINN